jgi:hypothetical protein
MGPPPAEDGSSPPPFPSWPSRSSSRMTYWSGPGRHGATVGLTAKDTFRSRGSGELEEEGGDGESCLRKVVSWQMSESVLREGSLSIANLMSVIID